MVNASRASNTGDVRGKWRGYGGIGAPHLLICGKSLLVLRQGA